MLLLDDCGAVLTVLLFLFHFLFLFVFFCCMCVLLFSLLFLAVSPTIHACIKVDCCEIYCILFGVFHCTFITLVALHSKRLLLLLLLFRNR